MINKAAVIFLKFKNALVIDLYVVWTCRWCFLLVIVCMSNVQTTFPSALV